METKKVLTKFMSGRARNPQFKKMKVVCKDVGNLFMGALKTLELRCPSQKESGTTA